MVCGHVLLVSFFLLTLMLLSVDSLINLITAFCGFSLTLMLLSVDSLINLITAFCGFSH